MLLRFIAALIGSLVIRAAALDALRPRLDSANHDPASQAACLTALRGDFAPTGQAPLAPLDPEKITHLQATYVEIGLLWQIELNHDLFGEL